MVMLPSPLAHELPPWAREGRGIGLGAVYYCTYAVSRVGRPPANP